jgi:hypothetical protein
MEHTGKDDKLNIAFNIIEVKYCENRNKNERTATHRIIKRVGKATRRK